MKARTGLSAIICATDCDETSGKGDSYSSVEGAALDLRSIQVLPLLLVELRGCVYEMIVK